MNLITDKNGIIVDIASEKENLSRGYTFTDYKMFLDVPDSDYQIGDQFVNDIHIPDADIRAAQKTAAQNEQKIQAKIRQTAIDALKSSGDLPVDFEG